MSMAQTKIDLTPSGDPRCPNCKAGLPSRASFCASCGERIVSKHATPLYMLDSAISTRYRITSLARRRPYNSLFFALDNLQQRPVALREISIRGLDDEARQAACETVQQEYDLLRREHIAAIMPVIDLRHHQGMLYVAAGWPAAVSEKGPITRLQTLQDVLQSGIGLPDIRVALAWSEQLCQALDQLHQQSIVPGDLDPQSLVLNGSDYNSDIALMVAWLPAVIRLLRPPASTINNSTHYSAPEVLLGKPEPASDVYSLGAILYLLLTGVPPVGPDARAQRRLRAPGEVNPHINAGLDEIVMRAMALESAERYSNLLEMAEAIYRLRTRSGRPGNKGEAKSKYVQARHTALPGQTGALAAQIATLDTLPVTPPPQPDPPDDEQNAETLARIPLPPQEALPASVEVEKQPQPQLSAPAQTAASTRAGNDAAQQKSSLAESIKKRITGIMAAQPPRAPGGQQASNSAALVPVAAAPAARPAKETDFLAQLRQFMRGEQQHAITAAAIIETPLRVQPDQPYSMRIQIMGRNRGENQQRDGQQASGGLSALCEGELVSIEVRSALYQNYAYIVQQASVTIPAGGYAAEVTIPMQPLSSGPSGRRDRLHICFMDGQRQQLYEKPFVVELFVSHLVQPGREGHNVIPIPL
jgi:serine/threonine protein kinase